MDLPRFIRQFSVAEIEANPDFLCRIEKRLAVGVRHVRFEERVDLGLVLHGPTQEKGGERKLREDVQSATLRMRLFHEFQHLDLAEVHRRSFHQDVSSRPMKPA